jgi:putative ABC transport system substrate-binding protein
MLDKGRREFIALLGGAAATWPIAARGQQPTPPTIGYLSIRSAGADAQFLMSFRQALNAVGFVDGRNLAVEYRFAEGRFERLPVLAADLAARHVALIVATGGTPASLAAKAATATIPIVFTTGDDPVQAGLVHSLNRPGGNVTGVTTSFGEAAPKRLGILREILPKDTIIGVLVNPSDSTGADTETIGMRKAAQSIGQRIEILQARTDRDIDGAFARLIDLQAHALIVAPNSLFATQADQLIALAARHAVPTLYWRREFAQAGGLMSYGSSLADAFRVVGVYAGRILKGEKPGDLPVQQPTKFELVVNAKAAKAIGLAIPEAFLARADEVIE